MKLRLILLVAFILTMTLSLGCAKKPVGSVPGDGQQAGQQGPSEAELAARNLEQAKRVIMSEKVYFAFNSYDLSPEARTILGRKADVLRQQTSLKVIIEGHCDERGTEEYNLALGERRAQAAYKYLSTLGVNPAQLETISYGEERPAVSGHGEAAWAQNRRCEFRLVW
jgi:peptidoglycan-associated lipoprotein